MKTGVIATVLIGASLVVAACTQVSSSSPASSTPTSSASASPQPTTIQVPDRGNSSLVTTLFQVIVTGEGAPVYSRPAADAEEGGVMVPPGILDVSCQIGQFFKIAGGENSGKYVLMRSVDSSGLTVSYC